MKKCQPQIIVIRVKSVLVQKANGLGDKDGEVAERFSFWGRTAE